MADNFNLRQFLTENKLTKNAKLLAEAVTLGGKSVDVGSIEIEDIDTADYPDFSDAYISYAEYEDGTPLSEDELMRLEDENYGLTNELIHDRQMYMEGAEVEEDVEYDPSSDQGMFQQYMPPAQYIPKKPQEDEPQPEKKGFLSKVKSMVGLEESTLSPREKYLTRLVESALGLEGYGDDNVNRQREKQGLPPAQGPKYSEGISEEEMVQEKPIPSYKSIEELMKNIEHGTNETAAKYKMEEMKRIAQALEEKVTSLEEGEHAEHIDPKQVKQMKKDIMTLRKQAEKLEKEYDKKFGEKKSKKQTQTENKMENFNLKKFLVENKLTTNSKMLNEEIKFIDANDPVLKSGGTEDLKPEDLQSGKTVIIPKKSYRDRNEVEANMGIFTRIDDKGYVYWKTKDGKEKSWPHIEDLALVKNYSKMLNEELSDEDIEIGAEYTAMMPTDSTGNRRTPVKVKVLGRDRNDETTVIVTPLQDVDYKNAESGQMNRFTKGSHYNSEAKYLSK